MQIRESRLKICGYCWKSKQLGTSVPRNGCFVGNRYMGKGPGVAQLEDDSGLSRKDFSISGLCTCTGQIEA